MWKQLWPDLPIHQELFKVSKKDEKSVRHLWKVVNSECQHLLTIFTKGISRAYLYLLERIKKEKSSILQVSDLKKYLPDNYLFPALRYLHSVGDIVYFPEGIGTPTTHHLIPSTAHLFLVQIRTSISNIIGQFIPDELRKRLTYNDNRPEILEETSFR